MSFVFTWLTLSTSGWGVFNLFKILVHDFARNRYYVNVIVALLFLTRLGKISNFHSYSGKERTISDKKLQM